MKNLLKLTVLALTVVLASCTNYDDQFANLESQIAALKTQVEGFSTLSSGLSTLQGTVTSLQAAVAALPTSTTDISGLTAGLTAAQTSIDAINAAITALAADVAAGNATSTDAAASIVTLTADLAAVQASVSEILASNNVYTGDVVITNAAELAFAKQLGGKVAIINGDVFVKVNTANALSATEVSAVTKLMSTVVGDLAVDTNADLDFAALTSVSGKYVVVGHSISAAKLTNVGSAYLDYDGSLSIGDSSIETLAFGTPKGATTVDFGNVTTNTTIFSAPAITVAYSGGAVSVTNTSSTTVLNLGDAVTFITGSGVTVSELAATTTATTITLGGTVSKSLKIVAKNAAVSTAMTAFSGAVSVTAKSFAAASAKTAAAISVDVAGAVDLSSVVTVTNVIINDTANNAITFPALVEASSLTVSTTGALTADSLKNGAVTATGPTTVSLAAHTTGNIAAAKATTLTVANYNETGDAAAAVKTLTLKAQTADLTTTTEFPALVSIDATGKAAGTADITIGNTATTTTVVAKGPFDSVAISGAASVTAVTTSGVINDVRVIGTTATSLSLGHTHKEGGTGSILAISSNSKLTSLTTSTDYMNVLNITNNAKLASFDLSSYAHKLLSGTASLTISGNALTGAWTNPSAVTSTTAYVEATLTQASLSTIKTFVTATASGSIDLSVTGVVCTIDGGTSTDTLANLLTAASVTSTILDNSTDLDTTTEFTVVK